MSCLRAPRDIQLYMLSWVEDKYAVRYFRTCKQLNQLHCLYDYKDWVTGFNGLKAIGKVRKLKLMDSCLLVKCPFITHIKCIYRIEFQWLPSSLKYLALHEDFNAPLGQVLLSTSLKALVFGKYFNQPVDGLLPDSLTYLSFGEMFDQPVNKLPTRLLHLFLNYEFQQPLDKLPQGLESLYLYGLFRLSLEHLPQSLKTIRLPLGYGVVPRDKRITYDPDIWARIQKEQNLV